MGQVEFQHEPLLSGAPEPPVTDFSPENDSADVLSVLNNEGALVVESEYSGWEPDSDSSNSQDQVNPSRLRRVMSRVAVPAAGVISAVAIACGGGAEADVEETATPNATETSTPTQVENTPSAIPTATPTETESPEPDGEEAVVGKSGPDEEETATVAPSPEPTEVVQEVPCQILPEEFCNQAEPILITSSKGDEILAFGFKDLPAGTPIMSPIDANVTTFDYSNGNSSWNGKGSVMNLSEDGSKIGLFIGDIGLGEATQVGAGNTFTTIQGSGVNNFGYNLIVYFSVNENGMFSSNDEINNALFPNFVEKDPVGTIELTETSATFAGYHFVD